jgi:hypothetical protein
MAITSEKIEGTKIIIDQAWPLGKSGITAVASIV